MRRKARVCCGLLALLLALVAASPATAGRGSGKNDQKFQVEVLF